MSDTPAPTQEEMRGMVLACGWRPTPYGTFMRPGQPWHSPPWRLKEAYARVTGQSYVDPVGVRRFGVV